MQNYDSRNPSGEKGLFYSFVVFSLPSPDGHFIRSLSVNNLLKSTKFPSGAAYLGRTQQLNRSWLRITLSTPVKKDLCISRLRISQLPVCSASVPWGLSQLSRNVPWGDHNCLETFSWGFTTV